MRNKMLGLSRSSNVLWLFVWSFSQALSLSEWPANYELTDGEKFDFIIVGSGSAGAIVAARLSEVPHWNVLLIEAGGDPPPSSAYPALCKTFHNTEYDWNFDTLLDNDVGRAHPGGIVSYPRGKVLGGSSTINYLVYSRGIPEDYNDWGIKGWEWDTVLYYLKKFEGMTDNDVFLKPENAHLHSASGPVKISRPEIHPVFKEIDETRLKSFEELGIKNIFEHNGHENYGITTPHFTISNGKRSSTAEVYLKPIANRSNLKVAKYAEVVKVLIDPITHIAHGVEVKVNNERLVKVYTKKEIILSAGSVSSPKILLLSGVGPRKELLKFEINCIADLPVGKNLHDHPVIHLFIKGNDKITSETVDSLIYSNLDLPPGPVQMGYVRFDNSTTDAAYQKPQFQIFSTFLGTGSSATLHYICLEIMRYDHQFCKVLAEGLNSNEINVLALSLAHPLSRGQLKLRSNNHSDDPIIELGYFRNETDLDVMTRGVNVMKNLVKTSYFQEVNAKVFTPAVTGCKGIKPRSKEYWRCYSKHTIMPFAHMVGTCKMGEDGVVDERLKVHGVHGLRVIDASIVPLVPSGNTNAAAMMIGEKGADIIKEDWYFKETSTCWK